MTRDFAVAIYRGQGQGSALALPERFELWSVVAGKLAAFYPPGELLQMELRLRTGRAWETEDGSATLVPLLRGSQVEVEQMVRLLAASEAEDAIKH